MENLNIRQSLILYRSTVCRTKIEKAVIGHLVRQMDRMENPNDWYENILLKEGFKSVNSFRETEDQLRFFKVHLDELLLEMKDALEPEWLSHNYPNLHATRFDRVALARFIFMKIAKRFYLHWTEGVLV